jgi:hypothetical protein
MKQLNALNLVVLLVFVACSESAGQQPGNRRVVASGTANGKSFEVKEARRDALVGALIMKHLREPKGPADEQEIAKFRRESECSQLRDRLYMTAREEQKKRFAISVTKEELVQARTEWLKTYDPAADAAKARERATILLAALTEVYEKGGDPKQVYEKSLAGHDVHQTAWAVNLYLYRTLEARARLTRQATAPTPDSNQLDISVQARLENEQLDAAVDREIGSNDGTFRAYRKEQAEKVPHGTGEMPGAHLDYLQAKRMAWWKARYAKMSVTLSDPAMADRCGLLQKLGVRVPGSNSSR